MVINNNYILPMHNGMDSIKFKFEIL